MKVRATGVGVLLTSLALLQVGCLDRELRPITPCVSQGFIESIEQEGVDKVDMLFMVDNSGSMEQEQTSLATNFPRMVRALVTGDRDGDPSTMDDQFPAVKDLHVGVVTSDMGTANTAIQTCNLQPFGEDGVLRTRSSGGEGCAASYPAFLSFVPNEDGNDTATNKTPDQFAADFACVAKVGITGCGFEQQLEASLKALTPQSSLIRFFGDTTGQGDRANNGFLRADSLIAVVLVTDEEDCSFADSRLVDESDPTVSGTNLNLRCVLFPQLLHPVSRYIDGLKALRPNNENLVVFAAITGIPTDLVPAAGEDPNYGAILSDPRLEQVQDPSNPNALRPSCQDATRGKADPPRRIIETARGFGRNATVQSICQSDFTPAIDAIVAKIADNLNNVCLPRKLNPNVAGDVGCDVVEVLPQPGSGAAIDGTPTRCQDIPGCTTDPNSPNCPVETTPLRIVDGQEYCRMKQLSVDRGNGNAIEAGAGWYYDDFSSITTMRCSSQETAQRIAFTDNAQPGRGVRVSLECLQRVQSPGSSSSDTFTYTCNAEGIGCPAGHFCDTTRLACERIELGSFCVPGDGTQGDAKCSLGEITINGQGRDLSCDTASRSCQLTCQNDSECPSSFVCNTELETPICVNPICL